MAYKARVTYTASGREYPVTFAFIDAAHLRAAYNGLVEVPTYSGGLAVLSQDPTTDTVVIYRVTPTGPTDIVDFADGSRIRSADLDLITKQNMYALEELEDRMEQVVADYEDILTIVSGDEEPVTVYWNNAQSYTAYCGSGLVGSNTANVAQGTYYSLVSQALADAEALAAAVTEAEAGLSCALVAYLGKTQELVRGFLQTGTYTYIWGDFSNWFYNGAYNNSFQKIVRVDRAGVPDIGFTPVINNDVYGMAVLSSGRIIIGGTFTLVNGVSRNGVAVLNSDGTLYSSFDASAAAIVANGTYLAPSGFVEDTDTNILVAGCFRITHPTEGYKYNLMKLSSTGELVTAFVSPLTSGQYSGSIRVAANGNLWVSSYSSPYIYEINPTTGSTVSGSLPTFDGRIHGFVDSEYDSGKVYVHGEFLNVGGGARIAVCRLNSDGSLDVTFTNPGLSSSGDVFGLAEDPTTGSLFIIGSFTTIQGNTMGSFGKLSSNGVIDGSWPNINLAGITWDATGFKVCRNVTFFADNGTILVGGDSTFTLLGAARAGLALLTADGTLITDTE